MTILLNNLSKYYADLAVVKDVSLTIEDGEMFVLLGSSGSGKSTVLRMIAGLVQPDNGRIELHGHDVTYFPPQERGVGFVFQNYSVFRHMTVAQNIAFGLRIRGVSAAAQKERTAELLELVELTGLGDRYARQLSGGQQQRVALARALAYEPAVLLLDEPFGALDVKIRTQLRRRLKEIQRKLHVTTIVVTHDQEEAFELADRIGVMERGELMEVGTAQELYYRPHTTFAATFVGGGNVLAGRMESGQIRLGSVTLPLPEDAPPHDDYAPVRILFRPETVKLQSRPFLPEEPIFPLGKGKVVEHAFVGMTQRLKVELDSLHGVRPLQPRLDFGQGTVSIQCTLLAQETTESMVDQAQIWVGLPHFHVLDQAGMRLLLVVADDAKSRETAVVAQQIAVATGGTITLLGIADDKSDPAVLSQFLRTFHAENLSHAPRVEYRVRQGNHIDLVLLEANEGHHEMVIMPLDDSQEHELLWRLLDAVRIPVLVVPQARPQLNKVLICTAVGEPGKGDIRFGGRIARRARAQVTLLHIDTGNRPLIEQQQAHDFMQKGQALLRAVGVATESIIETAVTPQSGIMQELNAGDYDLLVLGAPVLSKLDSSPDATIINQSDRPVLFVPMLD
ncbi:MAG: ATP-binding cassette domain-containing protein [Anaerolineae bacterium]|nr:ATP-binding cassette domain-containing protein [Anaerolineae bacterium]